MKSLLKRSLQKVSVFSAVLVSLTTIWSAANAELINVTAAKVGEANTVLVTDSFRRTLYVFDPDKGAATPQCNEKCAETWPPLTITAAEAGQLDNARLTTIVRTTGLVQLQFDGRPVYTFNQDRLPGDIKGNGLGNVWHVIPFTAGTTK
jgi:predicted lipoprotein with Yx(FWY)xxD motif